MGKSRTTMNEHNYCFGVGSEDLADQMFLLALQCDLCPVVPFSFKRVATAVHGLNWQRHHIGDRI